MKYLNLIITLSILFYSCSQNTYEEVPVIGSHSFHRISTETAKQYALEFVNKINHNTRLNLEEGISVSVFPNINSETRCLFDSKFDSLFYIVNLGDNGFVITASDNRPFPILAYIENGFFTLNDSINNGYTSFLYSLIETEMERRNNNDTEYNDDNTDETDENSNADKITEPDERYIDTHPKEDVFEIMLPLLQTKWGQDYPYNMYCNGYTGCVVTAISQICSFLEKPEYLFFNQKPMSDGTKINWQLIKNESLERNEIKEYSGSIGQIAMLMKNWGEAFNAQYNDEGTPINSENALKIMKQEYQFDVTNLYDYNIDRVINDLKQGNRIVFMRGDGRYYHVGFVFRKYVDGHAWVVDGYIYQVKNNEENKYIHCNWGWNGNKNGYYNANVLNAETYPDFLDNGETRSSHNYKYNLKTATFIK